MAILRSRADEDYPFAPASTNSIRQINGCLFAVIKFRQAIPFRESHVSHAPSFATPEQSEHLSQNIMSCRSQASPIQHNPLSCARKLGLRQQPLCVSLLFRERIAGLRGKLCQDSDNLRVVLGG